MRTMRNAVALAAFAGLLPLGAQQQTITCSSNGASQACPADTRNGVLLVREQSNNVCRQGQTWTFNRRGINVNGGCSAEFLVNPLGGNGYGNSGYGNRNGNNASNGQYNNGQNNNGQYGGNANPGNGSRVTIPQGTQIAFRTEQSSRLNELNQNDVVSGTLASDLVVGGQTVAPAGTPLQARVRSANGSALDLQLDSMTVNGTTYTLRSNSVRGMRDAVSTPDASSGRGALAGVLNSLAGTIPAGSVFNFRLMGAARAQ